MTSSNEVPTTECDNDRQPDMMLLLLALVTFFRPTTVHYNIIASALQTVLTMLDERL